MKPSSQRRVVGAVLLALTLAAIETSSVFGKTSRHAANSARKPEAASGASYVGDCGPNYPPGYRYDLKNWTSRFAERDFSCYVLDEY